MTTFDQFKVENLWEYFGTFFAVEPTIRTRPAILIWDPNVTGISWRIWGISVTTGICRPQSISLPIIYEYSDGFEQEICILHYYGNDRLCDTMFSTGKISDIFWSQCICDMQFRVFMKPLYLCNRVTASVFPNGLAVLRSSVLFFTLQNS